MSFKNASLPIQKNIYNYSKSDYQFEILNAVIASSRRNRTINESDIVQEPGKLRTFKLNIITPDCDTTGSCSDSLCTPGETTAPKQIFYQLSKCTSSKKFSLKVKDARDLEDIDMNGYALQMISANLTSVRKKLAEEVTAFLVANAGRHADGSLTKQVQLVDSVTGVPKPFGINEIRRHFRDMQLNDPFVVGGYSAYHLRQGIQIGGLNAQGQRIDQVALPNLYYDNLVNAAVGSGENILAWDADYFKFMTYNENAGRFATNLSGFQLGAAYRAGETYMHTTIVDPVTQLLWDLDAIYVACDKIWNFQFRLNWDIFFLPPSVCLPAYVNGLVRYTGCELVEADCPEGNAPTAPTAETFSWTPSGEALPEYVAELKIGGKTFRPLVTVTTVADWTALLNSLGVGVFTTVSSAVQYSGFSALTGTYNGANAITFAAV